MEAWRITELANEAMESIEVEDEENYAFARSAIEWAIIKALDEERAAVDARKVKP